MSAPSIQVDTPDLLLTCARFWPDKHGGVESRMWEVSRRFAAHGTKVRALTENRISAAPRENIMPGLAVQRHDAFQPGRLWRWERYARIGWWRRVLAQQPRDAVVWATDPLQAAAAISLGMRDRLVFNPACCVAAMRRIGAAYPAAYTMQLPAGLAWVDRLAYRKAACVVVSSDNVRDQLGNHYGPRGDVHVVPHGAPPTTHYTDRNAARRALDLPENGMVVGFVGRLDPCKDLGFLFEAAASVLRANDRILIVGDGPDRDRLERIARTHNVHGRIAWAGRLNPPTQAYAAMDVLCLPSIYEAFGNVILEAMACGTPAISRRRDARAARPVLTAGEEIIEHDVTGLLVHPHDSGDLADQLRTLWQQPHRLAAMGPRAVERALAWTWDDTVNEYQAVLERLAPQRHPQIHVAYRHAA